MKYFLFLCLLASSPVILSSCVGDYYPHQYKVRFYDGHKSTLNSAHLYEVGDTVRADMGSEFYVLIESEAILAKNCVVTSIIK